MARRVFYSFRHKADSHRAAQVREAGSLEGNQPVSDNDWEAIKKGGDKAIEKWIDSQMSGRSCVVVLIGSDTAGKKWIDYEITKAWADKKGLLGVYIHNLKNLNGRTTTKGANPFDSFTFTGTTKKLSSTVRTYDPSGADSKAVYAYIRDHLAGWVEDAIEIRARN